MKTDIGMRRLLPTFTANSKLQEGVKRKDGRDAVRADTATWRVGWHYFKVSAHTALCDAFCLSLLFKNGSYVSMTKTGHSDVYS